MSESDSEQEPGSISPSSHSRSDSRHLDLSDDETGTKKIKTKVKEKGQRKIHQSQIPTGASPRLSPSQRSTHLSHPNKLATSPSPPGPTPTGMEQVEYSVSQVSLSTSPVSSSRSISHSLSMHHHHLGLISGGSISIVSQPSRSSQPSYNSALKLSPDDFDWGVLLGEGAYARVVLATRKSDLQQYAVKVVDKMFITKHKKVRQMMTEKKILSMCSHPNIVQLYFTFQDQNSLYYVLELAEEGEMFDQLKRLGSYDIKVARFYAAELVRVLEYLHGMGIIHRDLKPENILLSERRHIKLTDFGTAKFMNDDLDAKMHTAYAGTSPAAASTASTVTSSLSSTSSGSSSPRANSFVGTAEYVSPEVLNNQHVGPQADMWALGCVIFQMLTGKPPFRGASEYLTFQKIINRELEYPADMDPFARDLIDNLLCTDPSQRLGATPEGYQKLKAHPFFEGIDFDSLDNMNPPPIPDIPAPTDDDERGSSDSEDEMISTRPSTVTQVTKPTRPPEGHQKHESLELPSQSSLWKQFLLDDEKIVYAGLVTKGRGLWAKKRQLILTTLPRFVYVDPVKMVLKKEIQWHPTLWAELKNPRTFYIHTPKRIYYMVGLSSSATCWVREITKLQDYYLKHSKE